jgi:hypothetical protein
LGRPEGSVAISATWYLQPALEFYRIYLGIRAWQPVERRAPTALSGFDFYVVHSNDTPWERLGALRLIFEDQTSGVAVATAR